MEKDLLKIISEIEDLDHEALKLAKERQAKLAKPPGSLGELEEISIKFAGITGKVKNSVEKKRIIVLCADNGIIEEGVSCTPRSVTASQAVNMTKFRTGMSSMAHHFSCDVQVVDMGIADPYDCDKVLNRCISKGTKNFLKEDAMTRSDAIKAILTGIELAKMAKEDGINVIGVGEMGIGNTSTSSAVLGALSGKDIEEITGRGGGLTDEAFLNKKRVLKEALDLRKPNPNDVVDVISKVGGLDIAAMCGVFLGCARYRIPVVIDGFISVVAALCAKRLCEKASDYMFASHFSFEPGYIIALNELAISSYLKLNMRLGEGSGCVIAFQVIEAALAMMNDMALFGEEAGINDGYLDEIREGDKFSV